MDSGPTPQAPLPTSPALETVGETRLARTALEAVITVDQQQRIVMINPAGLSMFGLTHEQAIGMELARLIPERLRSLHAAHVQHFSESELIDRPMGKRGQLLGLRANGEEFPLEAAIFKSEVAQPSGNRVYYTALLRDLSELSRMSELLDQLNLQLRAVFERAPVAIWISERDRLVFANRACAQLIGLTDPAQLIGRSIFELLAPASHQPVASKLRAIEGDETVSIVAGSILRVDGSLREVELVSAALPDHKRGFVQMVINDVTQRSQERRELLRSRRTLRELSANLVDAREEERQRIARELHDELGQRLTALKLEVMAFKHGNSNPAVGACAERMLAMLDETVASTRRIAMDLRPLMLDDLGLPEAIEWLVNEFNRRTGINVDTRLGDGLRELSSQLVTTLYRIVQEALTNITRHARATRVTISLRAADHDLLLTIQDNGVGFTNGTRARIPGSFGLLGIRERVLLLGGRLVVGNAAEGGARLAVRVPRTPPVEHGRSGDYPDSGATLPLFDETAPGGLN